MPLFDRIGRDVSLQVNARVDDFVRMTKLLTSYQGAKFLANQALLRASNFDTTKGERKQSAIDSVIDISSVTASLLSQVVVNGTGTHFLINELGAQMGKTPYFTGNGNAATEAKYGGRVSIPKAYRDEPLSKAAQSMHDMTTGKSKDNEDKFQDAFHSSIFIEDETNPAFSDLADLVSKDTLPVILSVADDSHSTLAFRGFVNSINDSFNANWNTISYVGRNEPLYIYDSTTRTLGFTLQIPIFSAKDTRKIYQKVDILMSNMYGKYTPTLGLNQGTIMKVKVGDYFKGFGVMTSLTHAIDQNIPWSGTTNGQGNDHRLSTAPNSDDGRDLILPQVITLNLSFNVIHTYMPSRTTIDKLNSTELMYFVGQEANIKKKKHEE